MLVHFYSYIILIDPASKVFVPATVVILILSSLSDNVFVPPLSDKILPYVESVYDKTLDSTQVFPFIFVNTQWPNIDEDAVCSRVKMYPVVLDKLAPLSPPTEE